MAEAPGCKKRTSSFGLIPNDCQFKIALSVNCWMVVVVPAEVMLAFPEVTTPPVGAAEAIKDEKKTKLRKKAKIRRTVWSFWKR